MRLVLRIGSTLDIVLGILTLAGLFCGVVEAILRLL
jgi:hypothetical protein